MIKKFVCVALVLCFFMTDAVLAKAVKLNASNPALLGTLKTPAVTPKEKLPTKCTNDKGCPVTSKCVKSVCVSACESISCSGSTPLCIAVNHIGICSCTDTSCGLGRKCLKNATNNSRFCSTCIENDTSCACPVGKVADGMGSCKCINTKPCTAGQTYEANACACIPCPYRDKCGCSGVAFANGNGECIADPFTCPAGSKPNLITFSCNICAIGELDCNCPIGYVSNGMSGCMLLDILLTTWK